MAPSVRVAERNMHSRNAYGTTNQGWSFSSQLGCRPDEEMTIDHDTELAATDHIMATAESQIPLLSVHIRFSPPSRAAAAASSISSVH